jgi:hypothetical protein
MDCLPAAVTCSPTATHLVAVAQDTDVTSAERNGSRIGSRRQDVPFQCSTRADRAAGLLTVPSDRMVPPTAWQEDGLTQDTAVSWLSMAPAGFGGEARRQAVPSHVSASGRRVRSARLNQPTAMHQAAVGQDTARNTPPRAAGLVAGPVLAALAAGPGSRTAAQATAASRGRHSRLSLIGVSGTVRRACAGAGPENAPGPGNPLDTGTTDPGPGSV